jgi:hypothetical protein
VVAEVISEVERGIIPKVADIRERLAGATRAKIAAAAVRSAEQAGKDREKEKRRRAAQEKRDREHKEQQDRVEQERADQLRPPVDRIAAALTPSDLRTLCSPLNQTTVLRLLRGADAGRGGRVGRGGSHPRGAYPTGAGVMTFKDALRSSVAHQKPDPRVDAIAMLMALAETDPSISGATLIGPDGKIIYLDAETLRQGGQT